MNKLNKPWFTNWQLVVVSTTINWGTLRKNRLKKKKNTSHRSPRSLHEGLLLPNGIQSLSAQRHIATVVQLLGSTPSAVQLSRPTPAGPNISALNGVTFEWAFLQGFSHSQGQSRCPKLGNLEIMGRSSSDGGMAQLP